MSQVMIIIVGTSHAIQIADPALQPFLESLCREYNVRAMAEEMSEEALAQNRCAASIPMQVASVLALPHKLCDPNNAERAKLEIYQVSEIRMWNSISNSALSESEIAARLKESYEKRERYWLERLRCLNVWPVLFICGSDHVASFCKLLEVQSIAAYVVAKDWASNNTVK